MAGPSASGSLRDLPILQGSMAGASDAELAIAVAKAGGLGALPAGMLSGEQVRAQVEQFRAAAGDKPLNLNFLAHKMPVPSNAREHAWRERLKPYYLELGIDPTAPVAGAARRPVRRSDVRDRRRDQARGRELPLWSA